jgi:hypothetical protein
LGVFAARDIAEGETVEIAPVVQLAVSFRSIEIELQSKVYDWEKLARVPGVFALALGYGSLYNHANPANLRYMPWLDGAAMRYEARVNIRAGAELTINYNHNSGEFAPRPDDWFGVAGIDLVDR